MQAEGDKYVSIIIILTEAPLVSFGKGAEKTKIKVPKNTKRKISSKRNNQTQNIKSV